MAGKPGRSGTTPGVAGPKRTEDQRILDRVETVRLLRRGWTKEMIAERQGVHPTTISWDFKCVLRSLNEEKDRDVEELVAVKLEELAEVKREAWAAWERSKEEHRKVTSEETPCPPPADDGMGPDSRMGKRRKRRQKLPPSVPTLPGKRVITTQGQSGDPRYLRTVLDCLHAECELQSLYPAKEITGRIAVLDWDALAQRIPDGPGAGTPGSANSVVPDVVEEMIARALGYDPKEAIRRIEMERPPIDPVQETIDRNSGQEEGEK